MTVKVGFAKLGNIGSAPLIEFLLDERAERDDVEVRAVGSGASVGAPQAVELANLIASFKPNLTVVTTPNAKLEGPMKMLKALSEKGLSTVVVSDSPAKSAISEIEAMNQGYIIVEADSMIGARKEFLDPIEMAIFNADIIKVLAVTGVYRAIHVAIDDILRAIKEGRVPHLPRIILAKEAALEASGLKNPYARAKALAAYEIATRVGGLTFEACFKVKEMERYVVLVAAAHEMIREAARLADEAREVDKYDDAVLRAPHAKDGSILQKLRLLEKPSK